MFRHGTIIPLRINIICNGSLGKIQRHQADTDVLEVRVTLIRAMYFLSQIGNWVNLHAALKEYTTQIVGGRTG